MPAAKTKADLLAMTRREYARLDRLIAPIPDALATTRFADEISIKDTIAHRAHWIDLFLGWVADGLANRPVYIPDKGVKWNALKAYNAQLRANQSEMGWTAARDRLATRHDALITRIETLTEAQLFGGPMPGHKTWTTGRFAEAAGASHYRSAAKYIRACLKQAPVQPD